MYGNVSCSWLAYEKLRESGILKKIADKRSDVFSFMLYDGMLTEEIGKDVWDWANSVYFDKNRGINEESMAARDVLNFAKEIDETYFNIDTILFYNHPSFLGKFVLGDDLDYKSKGFNSLSEMYRAIAAYCVESRFELENPEVYVWRNEKSKNKIDLNVHGDFFVFQNDISSGLEKTLFGYEFEVSKYKPFNRGISSYQDSSHFLYSVLKYAEHVGMKNIPEIRNWENTLDEVGSFCTATAECLFGGGSLSFGFFERGLPRENVRPDKFPILINGMSNGHFSVPFISKDDNLCYKRYEDEDVISPGGVRLEFTPEDIPDLLKGTYRLFTRDKTLLPKVMEGFLVNK